MEQRKCVKSAAAAEKKLLVCLRSQESRAPCPDRKYTVSADMLEKMLNVNVHLTSGQDGMRGVFPPGRGLAVCEQYKKCTIMQ